MAQRPKQPRSPRHVNAYPKMLHTVLSHVWAFERVWVLSRGAYAPSSIGIGRLDQHPSIDFTKDMVIVLRLGEQTGGAISLVSRTTARASWTSPFASVCPGIASCHSRGTS